jgi:putative nucleotidyltransferase with HDIG domain
LISSISFSVIAVIIAFILEKDRQDLVDINKKLQTAYEETLEGWAKALELKDRETERHSKQVVNYTLEVARKLGLSEEEISHILRGALLHDIGKMAIPDHILHKPGKLTDEEWEIMMQHPVYAYNFLSKIDYLRPALDIPRYHHERWDGTGYPFGLVGDEIPLSARIFSVVDVWDALNSDRPYRKAWSAEKTTAYLQEQAGKLFDPDIVLIFLKLLDSEKASTK